VPTDSEAGNVAVDRGALAELAVSIWRIDQRARRNVGTPESVVLACETARDRLGALGIELRDLTGQTYDSHLRVRVVAGEDSIGATGAVRIAQCLSPAVYRNGELIRPAEVTIEEDPHGATDR